MLTNERPYAYTACLNKGFKFLFFPFIHCMMAFQECPQTQQGLYISVPITADPIAVTLSVIVSFNAHPGRLCLGLDIPLIKCTVATVKISHLEGITRFKRRSYPS